MPVTIGIDRPSYVINSSLRDEGNIEDFSYTINIDKHNDKYNQCAISSCTIPKSYYDLNKDSILRINENGVSRDITIPRGNYNISNIQTVLLKLLNRTASDPIYNIEYPNCGLENDTRKFTFTHNKAYPIYFEIIGDNRLHDILGFSKDISGTTQLNFTDVDGIQTLISENAINLEHTKYIVIKSNICYNQGATDGDPDILARIPIDDLDKTVIHYRSIQLEDEIKTLVNVDNNKYRFTLYDDEGRILDLNGNNWSFTLFISRYNYHDEISIQHMKVQNIEKLNIP
jgi:hypothetical protein